MAKHLQEFEVCYYNPRRMEFWGRTFRTLEAAMVYRARLVRAGASPVIHIH